MEMYYIAFETIQFVKNLEKIKLLAEITSEM